MLTARRACLWVIALHAIVAIIHNQAHQEISVALSALQSTFALVVIVVAPILAAAIIWRGSSRLGAIVLIASLLGALAFGVVNHYLVASTDNVAQVAPSGWGQIFTLTALGLALTELAGVLVGAALLRASGPATPRSR